MGLLSGRSVLSTTASLRKRSDHAVILFRIPLSGVGDGACNGPVSVDADEGQVEDGRRTEKYVRTQPQLTQRLTERPVTHQLIGQRQRHDEYSLDPTERLRERLAGRNTDRPTSG